MNIHELQEGSKEWDDQKEEVGDWGMQSMYDEEVSLVDGVFEGPFGALGKSLIRSENDTLTFDGAVQINTFNLKKLTDIVGSKKI
nr:hypothetical protein [Tanacetum cinerariifolium]